LFLLTLSAACCQNPPEHWAVDHRYIVTGTGPDDWQLASSERVFFGLVVPGDHYELCEQQVLAQGEARDPDFALLHPIYDKRAAIYGAIISQVQRDGLRLSDLWQQIEPLATATERRTIPELEDLLGAHNPINSAFLDYVKTISGTHERLHQSELAFRFREKRLPPDGRAHYFAIECRLKQLSDQVRLKIANAS